MKQTVACCSRQHLVPSLRRVQSGRSLLTRSTLSPTSRDPFQARTVSSHAELPGKFEGVPHANTQRLPTCDGRPLSARAYREMMQRDSRESAAFDAHLEELRQRQVANSEAVKKMLQRVPVQVNLMRGAAVQILMRLCGKQEHRTTPSEVFAQLIEAKDSGVQQVAASLGLELAQLGEAAEAILAHHDGSQVPLQDMEDLDSDVDALQLWVTPALRQSYPHECRFMQQYKVIKQAVPERFT